MKVVSVSLVVLMAALGYTIFTLETYKTFFFPSKPRGTFAGKPILYPDMLRRRQHFVPIYAAIWVLVLTGFWLRVAWLWQSPLPPVLSVLKELGVL